MYRKTILAITVVFCLVFSASWLQANNVFVLPDGASSRDVSVFDGEAMDSLGSFQGPAGLSLNTLATPGSDSPVTYWTYGSATSDAVVAVRSDLSVAFSANATVAASAGAVSPDGSLFLLLQDRLRVFDTTTNEELDQYRELDVGIDPIDLAVSPDSQYAFVLGSEYGPLTRVDFITRVDLINGTVAGTWNIPGISAAVSVGHDGKVYVCATNRVYILDGSDMSLIGEIKINGLAGKLHFTPDGTLGVAANRSTTFTALWVFDLETAAEKGRVLKADAGGGLVDENVLIAGDGRAFVTSNVNHRLYELTLDPVSVYEYFVSGVGIPSNVISAAVSNELPEPDYLYYADSTTLYRVDLETNNLSGTAPISGNVNRLAYAGQPSTNAPMSLLKLNDEQVIDSADEGFRPIIVRALDLAGRPVLGASVEWSTAFASTGVVIGDAMTSTNLQGLAKAFVDPGETTGLFKVSATVGGSQSATFDLTVEAGTGGGGDDGDDEVNLAGIFRVSGNGQLLSENGGFGNPLVVQVLDAAGEPLPDATVEWEVQSKDVLWLLAPPSSTDEYGKAEAMFWTGSVPVDYSYRSTVVTASSQGTSVDFAVTIYGTTDIYGMSVPPPVLQIYAPSELSGKVGEVLEGAVRIMVSEGYGHYQYFGRIPNVSLSVTTNEDPELGPTASCTAGDDLLTGEDGVAVCDVLLGGKVGEATLDVRAGSPFRLYESFLTVVTTAGDPATVTILSGNDQAGDPGAQLPAALSAEVTDVSGNKLPDVPVTWEVVTAGTVILSNIASTTDSTGRVAAVATLGSTPGTHQVRLTAGSAEAIFTLTVELDITGLAAVSGDEQVAIVSQQFDAPLVVQLTDEYENPVPGLDITFTVESGPAFLDSPTVTTDANGLAKVFVTAGSIPDDVVIAASFGSLPALYFNLLVRTPGPAISPLSFLNGASFEPGVVPGSVGLIVGTGVADEVEEGECAIAETDPVVGMPYSLAEVSVQFGPYEAPIYHVCNFGDWQQVAVQAPFELLPGLISATVETADGSTTVEDVPVLAYQPGIFEWYPDGIRHAVALRLEDDTFAYVTPQNPAHKGDTIAVYVTGLGAVNPPVATNGLGEIETRREVQAPVLVRLNNEFVPGAIRSEYAAGMIGAYVIFFDIPQDDTEVGGFRPLMVGVPEGDSVTWGAVSALAIQANQ